MQYRAERLEQGFWVVKDSNNNPVSEKFKNKTQALSVALELNKTGVLKEKEATAPSPAVELPDAPIPERFTARAVGLYQGNDGCWIAVSIPFDPSTKETHPKWKEERAGLNKLEGQNGFRVMAGREIMSK